MQQKEGQFKGTGNFTLYWRCWLPDGQPKAVIVVAHGLGEHISRYDNLINHLVPRGYALYGLDHQGHGKSEGQRIYVNRFQVYLDDLKTFFDMVRKDNPNLKIFLLGHSMGGLIATAYTLQHQQELTGLIVSAPFLKAGDSVSGGTIMAARVVSVLAPRMGVQALDSTYLCRDKAVVEAYDKDPLVCRKKITARLGSEMFSTMAKIEPLMYTITLPILIMQGSDDKLVSQDGSKTLFAKAGSKDKTLKIYDGFYHEIFNEKERDKVFADLDPWLDSHAK
ncbi:MAG: lysophospholipase [Chloroflexi bacterium]|nr:lysophospholipase [Chloroflexota bacterium]